MTAGKTGSRFPVWLLACLTAALVGALGAGLQLLRFATAVFSEFSTSDWWLIGTWSGVLFVWVFGLGLIGGLMIGRTREKGRVEEAPVLFPDA